jgi:hypothetical protein
MKFVDYIKRGLKKQRINSSICEFYSYTMLLKYVTSVFKTWKPAHIAKTLSFWDAHVVCISATLLNYKHNLQAT